MAWSTPKTTWAASDAFSETDFNRMEGNIKYLYGFTLVEMAWDGFSPNPQFIDGYYRVIETTDAASPNFAELYVPAVSATSTGITLSSYMAAVLPSAIRPLSSATEPSISCTVISNGLTFSGTFNVDTSGAYEMRIARTAHYFAANDFNNSGTKGFPQQVFKWAIV